MKKLILLERRPKINKPRFKALRKVHRVGSLWSLSMGSNQKVLSLRDMEIGNETANVLIFDSKLRLISHYENKQGL